MSLYVNNEKVEDNRIEAEAERLRPHHEMVFADKDPRQRQEQLYRWSRENVIEAVLIRQAALKNRRGITPERIDAEYDKLLRQYGGGERLFSSMGEGFDTEQNIREAIAERLCIDDLLAKITADVKEPSEKDVLKFYRKNIGRFTVPESVRAAHIVRHFGLEKEAAVPEETMRQVAAELDKGADFALLAEQYSDCPDNGGDLGYFVRGKMVPAFEDVVFNMEPGRVSGIFQTEFGYHIAKVIDRKPPVSCPVEQVRELIVKELIEEARRKTIEKFVDAEKEKARIEDR